MLDSKQIKQLHLLESFLCNINATAVTKRKQVVLL